MKERKDEAEAGGGGWRVDVVVVREEFVSFVKWFGMAVASVVFEQ